MAKGEEIPNDFGEHTVSPQRKLDLRIPDVMYMWYHTKSASVFIIRFAEDLSKKVVHCIANDLETTFA